MAKTQALLKAQERCLAVGLTSVCDAGVEREDALLMESLQETGRLKLRIYAMLNPNEENLSHLIQATHATSDMGWAARLLGARIKAAYRYQDLLRQNG